MENKLRFHIKEYAHEQGMRLGDLARRLKMPLSNLSAIASGRRSVSLGLLSRIAELLKCQVSELFEKTPEAKGIYRDESMNEEILKIAEQNYSGIEKGWVHRVMFAHHNHYRNIRPVEVRENRHGKKA